MYGRLVGTADYWIPGGLWRAVVGGQGRMPVVGWEEAETDVAVLPAVRRGDVLRVGAAKLQTAIGGGDAIIRSHTSGGDAEAANNNASAPWEKLCYGGSD